jgi:hypothetical protein
MSGNPPRVWIQIVDYRVGGHLFGAQLGASVRPECGRRNASAWRTTALRIGEPASRILLRLVRISFYLTFSQIS